MILVHEWDKNWHKEIKKLISDQQFTEMPNSISKAEKLNKILFSKEGSNGIVCKLIDYLKFYDEDLIPYGQDSPCIAMNIDTFTDHLRWSRYENFPDNPVVSKDVLRTGYAGSAFDIPIVINNEIKTKIH